MSETKTPYTIPNTDLPMRTEIPTSPFVRNPSTERPIQVIYPYPPYILMEDGTYFETPDILTLVKMVYDARKRIETLEKEVK
jgi:hypothetical protein